LHTYEAPGGTRVHHNGDFSGSVVIVGQTDDEGIEVPFEDLKALVAQAVRQHHVTQLENAPADDILLGRWQ
jgi:hypothetical protein